jgi:hypothetical protein
MEESVHRWGSFIVMVRARVALLYSLDNNTAAQSLSLGIVSWFKGAAFEVEHRSSQVA